MADQRDKVDDRLDERQAEVVAEALLRPAREAQQASRTQIDEELRWRQASFPWGLAGAVIAGAGAALLADRLSASLTELVSMSLLGAVCGYMFGALFYSLCRRRTG